MQKIPLRPNTGNAVLARWLQWADSQPPNVSYIWLHAASVGEALAADPIVRRLQARDRGLRIVHTFTSSSVRLWRGEFAADRSDTLPGFRRRSLEPLVMALQPRLLMLSRGDLWPGMLAAAHAHGIPIVVVGGQISRASLRRKRPFRLLFSRGCRAMRWVGAVSDDDAAAWRTIGVPSDVVQITGDPRDDYLIERAPRWTETRDLRRAFNEVPCVVAGSLEKADEWPVFAGFANVRHRFPRSHLIAVPHDPNPSVLTRLERHAAQLQLTASRWPDASPQPNDSVTIVTRVGWLADLYALGAVAYVGGGMGNAGRLHSVAEPAVYAVPTLVGPGAPSSKEAERFLAQDAITVLKEDVSTSFAEQTRWVFGNPTDAIAYGLRARNVVAAGASRESTSRIVAILEKTSPDRVRQ